MVMCAINSHNARREEGVMAGLMRLCTVAGWDHFDAQEVGFKELYDMFQLVTEQLGQDAIVLDADDLLKYPGTTCMGAVHGASLSPPDKAIIQINSSLGTNCHI